jgi:hypothetical protein
MPRGNYSIDSTADGSSVLASGVAAKIDNKWVRSDNYPHHVIERTSVDETSHARPDMSPAKHFQSAMRCSGGSICQTGFSTRFERSRFNATSQSILTATSSYC